jgi:hypothetical protein
LMVESAGCLGLNGGSMVNRKAPVWSDTLLLRRRARDIARALARVHERGWTLTDVRAGVESR